MLQVSLNDLMAYTDWEREQWLGWFRAHDASALNVTLGPHGDGRFSVVGDLVRHIFSAEKRYVERLKGQPLTDTSKVPNQDAEALFVFGRQSRTELRELVETFPVAEWDVPREFAMLGSILRVTPRKTVIHVLLHEIRHWGQVATLLRLQGLRADPEDFLISPVLGGEFRRPGGT